MSMKTAYCTPKLQPVRAANGTSAQMPLRKGCSLSRDRSHGEETRQESQNSTIGGQTWEDM